MERVNEFEQRLHFSAGQRSAASDKANTAEQVERQRQLRLVAMNQQQVTHIEHPTTGERLTVAPADFPAWKAKGWRRYVEPLPDA